MRQAQTGDSRPLLPRVSAVILSPFIAAPFFSLLHCMDSSSSVDHFASPVPSVLGSSREEVHMRRLSSTARTKVLKYGVPPSYIVSCTQPNLYERSTAGLLRTPYKYSYSADPLVSPDNCVILLHHLQPSLMPRPPTWNPPCGHVCPTLSALLRRLPPPTSSFVCAYSDAHTEYNIPYAILCAPTAILHKHKYMYMRGRVMEVCRLRHLPVATVPRLSPVPSGPWIQMTYSAHTAMGTITGRNQVHAM